MEIISNWQEHYKDLFGKRTLSLQHELKKSGLFTKQALAELIADYPSHKYNLSTMGDDLSNPDWRDGHIAGMSGKDVIKAIENGRMWLNLRNVQEISPKYATLLKDIFAEFEERVPGFESFRHNLGILISSPKAQVFYHADVPGQSLWQISGRKRIYIYPNHEPFLKPKSLEAIIAGEQEEDIPYESWFDDHAEVYDLKSGQMLHWPLNGPHRVVNEDCLNISVTTEHYTNEIRNSYAVNYANHVMRQYLGVKHPSQAINGLAVYPKAALALAWKKLNLNKSRKFVRMIDFKADPNGHLGMTDVPAFEK